MATCEAVMQMLCGGNWPVPCLFSSDPSFSKSESTCVSRSSVRYRKRRVSSHIQFLKCSSMVSRSIGIQWLPSIGRFSSGNAREDVLGLGKCECYSAENLSGITAENGNGSWYVDNAKEFNTINVDKPNVLQFEDVPELTQEKNVFTSNGTVRDTLHRANVNSIEDEAWELLKESMVYYCGSPVGTIAATDPTSSNVLNYDQVFIRDFIPSGIAFLLKGEYDIVRNFILHTLQLQSWEKTMDCHSPDQGLMPASFKVRTVPLDGDDSATEEVLDPDFGEAAIGRVAPVDSGMQPCQPIGSVKIRETSLYLDFIDGGVLYCAVNFRIMVDYFVACIWKMLWRSLGSGEN
ncbi:unnamed protein product [Ilex paraguariensis]|uniref:Alkaline/neutral invertase n=1 Tax=Ilex paraguariensis TaxID=185542 RepID=A0ABC8QQ29_9AQUA